MVMVKDLTEIKVKDLWNEEAKPFVWKKSAGANPGKGHEMIKPNYGTGYQCLVRLGQKFVKVLLWGMSRKANPVEITTEEKKVLTNLLQAKVLRRWIFPAKRALVSAIMGYIDKFNKQGRGFRWTKTANTIISSTDDLTGH